MVPDWHERHRLNEPDDPAPQPTPYVATAVWGPIPRPPAGRTWDELMDLALAEAALAGAENEIPVGAVVVAPDGRLLGKGHNAPLGSHDPTAHAEMVALREAAANLRNYRLEGAVMVVTLEPCLMCAGAMVHARIAGVVYGAADLKTGAVSSCLDGLALSFHNHKIWHLGGVKSAVCAELLQRFFSPRRVLRDDV